MVHEGPHQPDQDLDVIGSAVTQLAMLMQVQQGSDEPKRGYRSPAGDQHMKLVLEGLKKKKKVEEMRRSEEWAAKGGHGDAVKPTFFS